MKRKRWRYVLNLLLVFGIALVLAVFGAGVYLSYQQAQAFVYPSFPPGTETPDRVGFPDWREATFTSADGLTLRGWFLPPPESVETPAPVVVFLHGLAADRTQHLREAKLFHDQGYAALVFDMRNHGHSDGDRTSMGLFEADDAVAAVSYAAEQPEVDPDRIALYGHSMGGATAILATARLPQVKALIVETAYTSLRDVVGDGVTALTGLPAFPWDWIVVWMTGRMAGGDVFSVRPIDAIPSIAPRPVLLIHGTDDPTIPLHHSQELYAAAGEPKQLYIVPGGVHGLAYATDPAAFETVVLPFLASSLAAD